MIVVKIFDANDLDGEPLEKFDFRIIIDPHEILELALRKHGPWIEWSLTGDTSALSNGFAHLWSEADMTWSVIRAIRRGEPVFLGGRKYVSRKILKRAFQENQERIVQMHRDEHGYIRLEFVNAM